MASTRIRTRKDGTAYTSVMWREQGIQRALSFDDHAAALRFAKLIGQVGPDEAQRIIGAERASTTEITLAEWLDEYVAALTGVQTATTNRYSSYVRNDITPVIGALPLSHVTEASVSRWIKTLEGSGKTVANKHGFLAAALNVAVRRGKITSNPCLYTTLPDVERDEPVFLTASEFKAIRDEMTVRWQPFTTWLVCTGMRFGEATALRVGDIDTATSTCRISRAWKYTGSHSEPRLGGPKTKAGTRTIDVPAEALIELDLDRTRTELLFPTESGGHIKAQLFHNKAWKPAIVKAIKAGKLDKEPRVHDLRHTCASWMIAAGVPLPVIQAHLGHESITTTIGTYGHLDRTSHTAAAKAISAALG